MHDDLTHYTSLERATANTTATLATLPTVIWMEIEWMSISGQGYMLYGINGCMLFIVINICCVEKSSSRYETDSAAVLLVFICELGAI